AVPGYRPTQRPAASTDKPAPAADRPTEQDDTRRGLRLNTPSELAERWRALKLLHSAQKQAGK
ncbi:MAG: hypothetical protein OEY28_10020, partial [Nitrospira sp.]|nr:hypothetical protein [Nitrospira sp.]